ncbi:transcription termination factor Rho [Nibricoccus sp. IMCC34717]|uniref:transcription termination factor Rho n=1 Tax=Nibricoccus sp. IMCC34717 TaxID=3034021 RepID=UPI0038500307
MSSDKPSSGTGAKRRGRPPKSAAPAEPVEAAPKRPRGRPKKKVEAEAAPELSFQPSPSPAEAPAPRPAAPQVAPEPAFQPAPERQPEPSRNEPSRAESAEREVFRPSSPAPSQDERRNSFEPRHSDDNREPRYSDENREPAQSPAESSPPANAEAPASISSEGSANQPALGSDSARDDDSSPSHGQGGPQYSQGHAAGGGGHEPFWKRDKRGKKQRNRNNKPWQQGGQPGQHGQHGHGQHSQPHGGHQKHPQQPPPPNLNPVFGELPNPEKFADFAALAAKADDIRSGGGEPLQVDKLYTLHMADLNAEARRIGAQIEGVPTRRQLLSAIFKKAGEQKRPIFDRGYLDLTDRGHGFIVHESLNYRLYPEDCYVPEALIRHHGLKRGHLVEVQVCAPDEGERCPSTVRLLSVMGKDPAEILKLTPFEELVPYYPLKRILLEAPEVHKDVSMRAVDILTPIGFGQRGLIVAPPRTGKTVLLQNMANSVSANFPEAKLILLLIDERPEEVTDFRRHTRGEVVSSTFDESPESHVHCAEMVGEKARRLVEQGEHVVILLDSITRLARAYNALASNSGKIMSGGMEATALQRPKRFFGAARNIEGGGSLTIMATALVDTGSRMDEVIFEEFKGTGNMELHLDRGLVDKRIFPAINGDRSGTRKEELIYHPDEMLRIHGLRRAMQGIPPIEAMEMLLKRLKNTRSNAEFLMSLSR